MTRRLRLNEIIGYILLGITMGITITMALDYLIKILDLINGVGVTI